jgi:5-enolpyruvylshikimate-3-phosphate synthase
MLLHNHRPKLLSYEDKRIAMASTAMLVSSMEHIISQTCVPVLSCSQD